MVCQASPPFPFVGLRFVFWHSNEVYPPLLANPVDDGSGVLERRLHILRQGWHLRQARRSLIQEGLENVAGGRLRCMVANVLRMQSAVAIASNHHTHIEELWIVPRQLVDAKAPHTIAQTEDPLSRHFICERPGQLSQVLQDGFAELTEDEAVLFLVLGLGVAQSPIEPAAIMGLWTDGQGKKFVCVDGSECCRGQILACQSCLQHVARAPPLAAHIRVQVLDSKTL